MLSLLLGQDLSVLKKVVVIVERQSRCTLEVNKCVMELLGYWEFPYQSAETAHADAGP
jgi:hypothetical protein